MADNHSSLIGKFVLVNFPDNEGPNYYAGDIIEHLSGNKYAIRFEDGVADVYLTPRTRGIHWFIKKGDWNKFKAKRLRYYGGSGI